MSNTFLRQYHVSIESSTALGNNLLAEIENAQIQGKFKISGAGSSSSADANTLNLYNVEEAVIKATRKTGAIVTVRAGYRKDSGTVTTKPLEHPIIYKGEIVSANVERTRTDTITKLVLSSSLTEKLTSKVSMTFKKSTLITGVMESLAKTVGLEYQVDLGPDLLNTRLEKDYSVSGDSVVEIEKLCKVYKLTYFTQNYKQYIVARNAMHLAIPVGDVYRIESGRIKGAINWSTNTVSTKANDPESEGIKADFTTFLLPTIQVGNKIEVEIEGGVVTMTVEAIQHVVDFYGSTWETKIATKSESYIKEDIIFFNELDVGDIA